MNCKYLDRTWWGDEYRTGSAVRFEKPNEFYVAKDMRDFQGNLMCLVIYCSWSQKWFKPKIKENRKNISVRVEILTPDGDWRYQAAPNDGFFKGYDYKSPMTEGQEFKEHYELFEYLMEKRAEEIAQKRNEQYNQAINIIC